MLAGGRRKGVIRTLEFLLASRWTWGEDLDVLNRRPTALNTNYRRALRSGGPNGQILPGNKGAGPGRLPVRKRLKTTPNCLELPCETVLSVHSG
jgi:hypothetical protein